MPVVFTLEIYCRQELLCRHTLDRSVVIGRQERPDELLRGLAVTGSSAGDLRLAIEPLTEVEISRRQVRLRPLENGRLLVEGLSDRPLYPEFGLPIGKGESREFVAPFRLTFGPQRAYGLSVAVVESASAEGLQTLAHAAPAPGEGSRDRRISDLAGLDLADTAAEELGAWLHALLEVLQSAANSSDFYQRAAEAIVRLVGLHSGRVLLRDAGQWKLEACSVDPRLGDLPTWRPSHSILEHMARQRCTFWKDTSLMSLTGESLVGMQAIVAAPICNRDGEVIGALYGDRRRRGGGVARAVHQQAGGSARGDAGLRRRRRAGTPRPGTGRHGAAGAF